jgi:hypothetical protein
MHHCQLDGSSFAVRENLWTSWNASCSGRSMGPRRCCHFSPRSQYLVGHIAPGEAHPWWRMQPPPVPDDGRQPCDLVEIRTDADGFG